jgi:hypothetical protein
VAQGRPGVEWTGCILAVHQTLLSDPHPCPASGSMSRSRRKKKEEAHEEKPLCIYWQLPPGGPGTYKSVSGKGDEAVLDIVDCGRERARAREGEEETGVVESPDPPGPCAVCHTTCDLQRCGRCFSVSAAYCGKRRYVAARTQPS